MTSAQGRMRPTHPPAHRVVDLMSAFDLRLPDAAPVPTGSISGIAVGSSDIAPGDLFVALRGLRAHGVDHLSAALEAGASAVLTDREGAERCTQLGVAVPVLVADDPRSLLGDLSAHVYGHPGRALVTVGVTGTNGKTTTMYFVDAALRAQHGVTAVLGTVELKVGETAIESPRTTVEAPVLHGVLALAVEQGASAVVMEVSSHALALGRTRGLVFDVVGFTNLQRDHLDFHGDMAGYLRDKSRLFAPEQARRGVVVVDDEWGRELAVGAAIPVETLATHVGTPESQSADWAVTEAMIGLDGVGSTFTLRGPDGTSHVAHSPLPGLVNVSNAALAVVLALRAGVDIDLAITAVAGAGQIPGRMERVIERGEGWPLCLVDYAHTPDALELALEAVRPITPGRLIVVLGSDGDRDTGKRPIMGSVAARLADVVVITDENPRSEVPAQIRREILAGVRAQRPAGIDVHEASTRSQAIRDAIALAAEQDTIIITGKGHEPTQEIAGVFHRYNDRDVLLAARADREQASGDFS